MSDSRFFKGLTTWFCILIFLAGALHVSAATLRWAANPPGENIAFYTVYIESPLGSLTREVRGEPVFALDELLPSVTYALSVSATSVDGFESERSTPVPYIVGFPVPTITAHPGSMTLASGTPLVLSVAAIGPVGIKYEWYKDNRIVPDQSLPLLSILDPTPNDSGIYTAIVSTPGGHVESHPAQIVVQDPPRIITQPASASLGVGTPFALSVNASGTNLRYQWYKAGQPIPGATNASLPFAQLTLADKSSYRVAVWNLVDRIASEAASLDVFFVPVSITGGPYSTNLFDGGTIRLTVDVSGSSPITFQWEKNGISLPWATNATLEISSAITNDSGSYRVSVANPISFITSQAANVSVKPPPEVSDCTLIMSASDSGFVRISGAASPNTRYELQRTDSLSSPNWVRVQDVVADINGRFQLSIPSTSKTAFIRTIRR